MDEFAGLTDFLGAMTYWNAVQVMLASDGRLTTKAPLYERPYLDGERLMIPRGPGSAEDSEGYTDYSILDEHGSYSLRVSGRSRKDIRPDRPSCWFGHFDDATKYFVGANVAEITRMLYKPSAIPVVNLQWLNRGLAPGWLQSSEPNPSGFEPATRYFMANDPGRFYFTDSTDTAASFLLNLTWRELNTTFSEGIPGAEDIPMPDFSDE
ncbi:hypothetical protein [Gordonia sp. DT101]|uniref:hypothetical protein n=1 Tax=Gordonia sp. DT101 TaxID=3416545 RepID=UPI003CED3D83